MVCYRFEPDSKRRNIAVMHLDKRLVSFGWGSRDTFGGLWIPPMSSDASREAKALEERFADVDGLERAVGDKYKVALCKAELFEWDAIVPRVLDVLRSYFGGLDMVEVPAQDDGSVRLILKFAMGTAVHIGGEKQRSTVIGYRCLESSAEPEYLLRYVSQGDLDEGWFDESWLSKSSDAEVPPPTPEKASQA